MDRGTGTSSGGMVGRSRSGGSGTTRAAATRIRRRPGTSTITTAEDTFIDVDLRLRVSDVETIDDNLTFNVKNPVNGSVEMVDSYTARFTPATNHTGSASFDFDVTD